MKRKVSSSKSLAPSKKVNTVMMGAGGVALVVAVLLCFQMAPTTLSSDAPHRSITTPQRMVSLLKIAEFNSSSVAFTTSTTSGDSGDSSHYDLVALGPIAEETTIFHVPRLVCVTFEDVSKSPVGKAVNENLHTLAKQLKGTSAVQIFLFALYLALERRNPLSPLQSFFESVPPFGLGSGALYWGDEELRCVDPLARWEAGVMRSLASSCHEAATLLCSLDEDICGESVTSDEMKWALTVYFHFNLQHQAIVPLVTFARYSGNRAGMKVSMNRRSGGLDVTVGGAVQKGASLTVFFPRGASTLLASRGEFDADSLGIDTQLDISSASKSSTGRRVCTQKTHELLFGATGRPRESLVECLAWLVATKEERASFSAFRENRHLMRRVYGEFQRSLAESLTHIPETCQSEQRDVFLNYTTFVRSVITRNLAHVDTVLAGMGGDD